MEPGFFDNYTRIFQFFLLAWWLWLPPVLFYAAWELWKAYLKIRYWKTLEWVLLEIRIPREVAKSPQAMEQIFAGLHAMYRPFDPDEMYLDGLQHDYFVCEMMSHGGDIHFFIYAPKKFRNLVEAHVYAQYPDSEIREADDPLKYLPETIPNESWNLFASEFKLGKENPYPIRTYKEFIIEDVKEESRKVDPVSAMAELLSRLKPDEHAAIQLMVRPISDAWKGEGTKIVHKLIGKKITVKPSFFVKLAGELSDIVVGPAEVVKKEERSPETLMMHLSPGEKNIVSGIEQKMSKIGYECVLRFVYIAKREVFDQVHFASMVGALRQFNTQDLNSFKINSTAVVGSKWYSFSKKKTKEKKRRAFYSYYRSRQPFSDISLMKSKPFILNIEELASIYHFPGVTVGAPSMPRLQSRRAEPPSGLPVG